MGDKIFIQKEIQQHLKVDLEVDIDEVIDAINEVPIAKRWNYIAKILNGVVNFELKDLEDNHKDLVKSWLENRLKKFEQ